MVSWMSFILRGHLVTFDGCDRYSVVGQLTSFRGQLLRITVRIIPDYHISAVAKWTYDRLPFDKEAGKATREHIIEIEDSQKVSNSKWILTLIKRPVVSIINLITQPQKKTKTNTSQSTCSSVEVSVCGWKESSVSSHSNTSNIKYWMHVLN